MSRKGFTPLRGFTLIELVVVIAIIATLAASLLPSIQNMITRSRATRTAGELQTIKQAMNRYLIDVGSYPPWVGAGVGVCATWGCDVGLVNRGEVLSSHLPNWNGPYLGRWPVKTAMGPLGGSAAGAYYVHPPIGWINYDGIGGNDRWIHMNPDPPYDNYLASRAEINQLIDTILDDGVAGTGTVNSSYHIYYYVGEGNTAW